MRLVQLEIEKDMRGMRGLRSLTICWLVVALAASLLITSGGCSKGGSKDKAPFYKWLDVGFTFDRNMDNCGDIKVRTQTANTSITRDGRLGRACRFAGDATFQIIDLRIPDEVRFYVNGMLVRTRPYSGAPTKRVCAPVIGARWTGRGNEFNGDIDELLIYGRALVVEEIGQSWPEAWTRPKFQS